jgi:hypothetical protein
MINMILESILQACLGPIAFGLIIALVVAPFILIYKIVKGIR